MYISNGWNEEEIPFPAAHLSGAPSPWLLLTEVGAEALSPPQHGARGAAAARCAGSAKALSSCHLGGFSPSCWKIKEILFCVGMNPRGFEVLGRICWPGRAASPFPLSQNFKAAALG